MSHIKIGKGIRNVSEETLRFYNQIGVEEVSMPTRYHVPATDFLPPRPLVLLTQSGPKGDQGPPWDESELIRVKDRFESFGLIPTVSSLGLSGSITMGKDGRDKDLEITERNITIAGRVGLKVLLPGSRMLLSTAFWLKSSSMQKGKKIGGWWQPLTLDRSGLASAKSVATVQSFLTETRLPVTRSLNSGKNVAVVTTTMVAGPPSS